MGAPKQAQPLCPHAAPRLPTAAAPFPFPPDASNATVHSVRGPLRYYHYGLDGVRDHGWGCGYRTVQTMLSWLQPDEPPPDISTIQRLLKHAQPNAYPGDTGTHFSHMSHTPFPHISEFDSLKTSRNDPRLTR